MKPAGFLVHPCRGVLHTPRKNPRRRFGPKIERVLGLSLLGKVKSGAFLAYPDGEMWNRAGFARTRVGAQKHTPRNVPRRRFGPKTERVFGVSGCGNMKPAKFCTYPCRGVLHTPRNNPRRRFGSKIGQGSRHIVCGNMKPGGFFMYPCRGVLHTPRNNPRRRFGPKIGRVFGVSLLGRVKSGGFLAGTCVEI